MRTIRWMATGLALVGLAPAVGGAQSTRLFDNSWFWGAKVGLMSYSTTAQGNSTAPTFGIDWLITRSKGALYVAGEQAFFNATTSIQDRAATPNSYRVALRDMQRFTAAALAFPVSWGGIRPYAGVGLSMNLLQHVGLVDPIQDPMQEPVVNQEIDEQRDRVSFISMAGVQMQYKRISLFGQAVYMPAKANFLINGRTTYLVEGGIRYNFGPSIERTN